MAEPSHARERRWPADSQFNVNSRRPVMRDVLPPTAMNERLLPAGTQMFFGVPAQPIPEIMADAIGQVVAQVPGIREAYLPQCVIQGDGDARQVLVIGVANSQAIPEIMETLISKMKLVLPAHQFIDIIPFAISNMPNGARVAECKIFGPVPRTDRPWWKIW